MAALIVRLHAMGVEDQFYSVRWDSLLRSHAQLGPVVLDGYTSKFLEGVPVAAKTQLQKHHVTGYTDLAEFIMGWKDFDSPGCRAFIYFVQAISHTFESGKHLKTDLDVLNINDTCVFAPPRVTQIWEDALKSIAPDDLKESVDAVFGLELPFRYCVRPYPEFRVRLGETKFVWQDACERGNGIVIARW